MATTLDHVTNVEYILSYDAHRSLRNDSSKEAIGVFGHITRCGGDQDRVRDLRAGIPSPPTGWKSLAFGPSPHLGKNSGRLPESSRLLEMSPTSRWKRQSSKDTGDDDDDRIGLHIDGSSW